MAIDKPIDFKSCHMDELYFYLLHKRVDTSTVNVDSNYSPITSNKAKMANTKIKYLALLSKTLIFIIAISYH